MRFHKLTNQSTNQPTRSSRDPLCPGITEGMGPVYPQLELFYHIGKSPGVVTANHVVVP